MVTSYCAVFLAGSIARNMKLFGFQKFHVLDSLNLGVVSVGELGTRLAQDTFGLLNKKMGYMVELRLRPEESRSRPKTLNVVFDGHLGTDKVVIGVSGVAVLVLSLGIFHFFD